MAELCGTLLRWSIRRYKLARWILGALPAKNLCMDPHPPVPTRGIPLRLATHTEDSLSENEITRSNYQFVYRSGWHARHPKSEQTLKAPVPFVVIHHSYHPKACYDKDDCRNAMKSMQDFHMDVRGWADIGYNFGIGSDGVVYEGRGWNVLGAHALHFNTVSIGICLIGDWIETVPPSVQLQSAKALIAHGVKKGHIMPKYKLVGHRQVRDTECPGEALYKVIQKWSHYAPFPRTYRDLKNVTEIPAYIRESLED
ncbi:peptidoglycan-recognition protein LB-like [Hyposmocoma kahamanoa]|uniref:peptidoglycan-recognition protein LB-like n=1 Tax=Hyposmocoma kahamanoa TaxID=1477025 RepID=UPI000E6D8F8F|nr:peptidoglycan-recognition protein LB-like [Hyposmocoma kahamanoa]